MKHISIIGGTLYGNRGAEAMVTTTIGEIRKAYPDTRISIFSYYPEQDQKLVNDPIIAINSSTPLALVVQLFPGAVLCKLLSLLHITFLKGLLPANVKALAQSDALICVAGVSFIDTRQKFLPFNILTIWPAIILGIPVFKFSQAIGPCNKQPNKLLSSIFLRRCSKIFARGKTTFEHLQELGLASPLLDEASDIAFLHKESYSLSNESEEEVAALCKWTHSQRDAGKTIVGICPSAVIAAKVKDKDFNYTNFISTVIRDLLEKGYSVLLFPNATRKSASPKIRNNDLPIIEKCVEYLTAFGAPCKQLNFVTADMNTYGIKKLISQCDLLAVSRFHAMIAALSLHKPTMVIGWGHKYYEVMSRLNLEDYVVDYKKNDAEEIVHSIDRLNDHKHAIEAAIQDHLPPIQTASKKQIDSLFDIVFKNA